MVKADELLPQLWADEGWGAALDDEARAALIAGVEDWLPPGAELADATAERLRAALLALGEQAGALAQGRLEGQGLVALCLKALGAQAGAPF